MGAGLFVTAAANSLLWYGEDGCHGTKGIEMYADHDHFGGGGEEPEDPKRNSSFFDPFDPLGIYQTAMTYSLTPYVFPMMMFGVYVGVLRVMYQ